jgi:general secretion pathway protein N
MGNFKLPLLTGIATLVIGLIITFPARVAYKWLASENLKLSDISGSIWHGNAKQGYATGIYLKNIKWNFQPLTLLAGKFKFLVSSNPTSGFLDANIEFSIDGRITMSDIAAAMPLSTLQDALPLGSIQGDLSLQLSHLVIKDSLPREATGILNIENLISPYFLPTPLGSFRAEFQTTNNDISASVESISDTLDLAGIITLTADRHYQFIGQMATKESAPLSITQQLQFMGAPNSHGQYEFRIEGQL